MAVNLASAYSKQVDEHFYKASQTAIALNKHYQFNGVKTVNVYSVPTVAMTNYSRTGANRYGSPSELQNTIQELTLTKDRAFTFTIDRGNKNQSHTISEKISRQNKRKCGILKQGDKNEEIYHNKRRV